MQKWGTPPDELGLERGEQFVALGAVVQHTEDGGLQIALREFAYSSWIQIWGDPCGRQILWITGVGWSVRLIMSSWVPLPNSASIPDRSAMS